MDTAQKLIERARALNMVVTFFHGEVSVMSAGPLTDEQIEVLVRMKDNKPAVVAAMRAESGEPATSGVAPHIAARGVEYR
jgi:hypothetical protein